MSWVQFFSQLLMLTSVVSSCLIRGNNARKLGWVPQHGVEHLMSNVDKEVAFILEEDSVFSTKTELLLS